MMGFIGNIGPWELIFILLIALIVVGPGKLPEVAKSLGKATRDFKKATSGIQKDIDDVMKFDFEEEKKAAGLKAKSEAPSGEIQEESSASNPVELTEDAEKKKAEEQPAS